MSAEKEKSDKSKVHKLSLKGMRFYCQDREMDSNGL